MNYLPVFLSLFLISLSANGAALSRSRCVNLLHTEPRLAQQPVKKNPVTVATLPPESASTPRSTGSLSVALNNAITFPGR